MDLDRFIKFAKDKYGLEIVKVPAGKGLTFEDIFGKDFLKNNCEDVVSVRIPYNNHNEWVFDDSLFEYNLSQYSMALAA